MARQNADGALPAGQLPHQGDLAQGRAHEGQAHRADHLRLVQGHQAAVGHDPAHPRFPQGAAGGQDLLPRLVGPFHQIHKGSARDLIAHGVGEGGGVPRVAGHPGRCGRVDQDADLLAIKGMTGANFHKKPSLAARRHKGAPWDDVCLYSTSSVPKGLSNGLHPPQSGARGPYST